MPVAARPDVVNAVAARLRSFSEVTALTSTRVSAMLQPSWAGMPTYAVLVRAAGGPPGNRQINLMRSRIDLFCYGETPAKAAELWRQVDAVFCPGQERQCSFVQGSCRVGSVDAESEMVLTVEPDSEWPRASSSYIVRWMGVAP